jgi:alginate export protein
MAIAVAIRTNIANPHNVVAIWRRLERVSISIISIARSSMGAVGISQQLRASAFVGCSPLTGDVPTGGMPDRPRGSGALWSGCAIAVAIVCSGLQSAADWRDSIAFTLSDRARGEFMDWFGPPGTVAPAGAKRYGFFANQLRAGVRVTLPHAQLTVEAQDTRLVNLPDDATLAPPHGSLGPGAIYFLNTHDTSQGETFLKQGFATLRGRGFTAKLGRFEYRDGAETTPGDATLAFLKRSRINERLIGTFDFTHVTRSFDGGVLSYDAPGWNATAMGARPTRGGFEVSANRELDGVSLAGLALTAKHLPFAGAPPSDLRLFYFYCEDRRNEPLRIDNRALGLRQADRDAIFVHTIGGHAVTAAELGPGVLDGLVWAAGQAGEWGQLDHLAWAGAVELGYQLPSVPLKPWLRIGYDASSGDTDPTDGDHGTFFQMLPTARVYAQLPFFNLMNNQDLFAQLILRPHERVTIRTDYHWLSLTERDDLWYAGGGATNAKIFGFSGSPSGGHRELAHLVDLSATVSLHPYLSLGLYYGHAFGRSVVSTSFPDDDADYGFVELTFKY